MSVWYRFEIYDCFQKIEKKLLMKILGKILWDSGTGVFL